MEKDNQCTKIYEYMKNNGSITAAQAFLELNIMRLAARISDLRRQGVEIDTTTRVSKNGSHYAVYTLKGAENVQDA